MDKMKSVFEALNKELEDSNLTLTLICVGGFVLEYHGLRATQDVDAFFEENQKINEIIYKVGQQFHLNTEDELWLNNNVANMNVKPSESICETLYHFTHLTVLIAPIEYVLGMKMVSTREQDVRDIGSIIKFKNLQSPFRLYDDLLDMGFHDVDFSILLEGFSYAYGIEWLEEFFKMNQEKISQYY